MKGRKAIDPIRLIGCEHEITRPIVSPGEMWDASGSLIQHDAEFT
jgi:hypothetical protein